MGSNAIHIRKLSNSTATSLPKPRIGDVVPVIPPTIRAPFTVPAVAAEAGSEAGELISELRDEERW
jgi:hypothetical protein